MSDGLLDGVRVLDFSIWRPGPYATQLLAEAGADVLKVEPPGGDPMRAYPDLFAALHANKRSIVLDLKDDVDRARARALATDADVVIEGFRPGVAARLGIDEPSLRTVAPSLVYCSLSGMGQTGPLADVPGHDLNYLAWAGTLAPEGGEPVWPKPPVADLAGGLAAAFAVCAALVRRQRTGEGEYIDLAMADVLASWTGEATPRMDSVETAGTVPGYGVFATADGHLTLGIVTEDHFWRALCKVLAMDDCADLPFAARAAIAPELQARIASALATFARDDAVERLLAAGVPAAPVWSRADMLASPHFRARGAVTTHLARYAAHPAGRMTPPPGLDEHRGQGFRERDQEHGRR